MTYKKLTVIDDYKDVVVEKLANGKYDVYVPNSNWTYLGLSIPVLGNLVCLIMFFVSSLYEKKYIKKGKITNKKIVFQTK